MLAEFAVQPWDLQRYTPHEERLMYALHQGDQQESHVGFTEAVRRGW